MKKLDFTGATALEVEIGGVECRIPDIGMAHVVEVLTKAVEEAKGATAQRLCAIAYETLETLFGNDKAEAIFPGGCKSDVHAMQVLLFLREEVAEARGRLYAEYAAGRVRT